MSLFFVDERRPKVVVPDLVPDWDSALEAISKHLTPEAVAAIGSLTIQQSLALIQKCRDVEPLLLRAIQLGTVTTALSAVEFLRANTDGVFPAVRFIARMQANVGTELVPATWLQVVDAANTEDVGL